MSLLAFLMKTHNHGLFPFPLSEPFEQHPVLKRIICIPEIGIQAGQGDEV
jgi:hypothetical protein